MGYRKGKDGKIKGIEHLDGMPDYIIYKTNRIEAIIAEKDCIITTSRLEKKPEDFDKF